jgi:restriction system protein
MKMAEILDYSQYLKLHARDVLENGGDPGHLYIDEQEDNRTAEAFNRDRFFRPRGVCPFCRALAPLVYNQHIGWTNVSKKAWSCAFCGWWECEMTYWGGQAVGHPAFTGNHYQAILRTFQASDKEIPVESLLQEISRRPRLLHDIDPTKLEELVGSVFKSFYSCEVIHCGRSHDGGVDLVLVDSDQPTLVQVKRRRSPESVEPVSTIREFLGALVAKRATKGLFVSTADHFSGEAKRTVQQILSERVVTRFELVDFNAFVARLSLAQTEATEPWQKLVEGSPWQL